MKSISINEIAESDWSLIWKILEPVLRSSETYAFSPNISETEPYRVWVENPIATYVAKDNFDNILGTYFVKANQPTLDAHVCNCGYIISESARGKGIASLMCQHSQQEAKQLGFRAMQFNLVVSTNEVAIRLWQKLCFEIIGTLTQAFKHSKYGFVDAFIMYKQL